MDFFQKHYIILLTLNFYIAVCVFVCGMYAFFFFFCDLGFAVHLRVQIALFSKKLQPIEIRSQSTGMAGISHRQKGHVKRDKKERERGTSAGWAVLFFPHPQIGRFSYRALKV